ncbi:hypothetical protein AMK59_5772, partial [Oryctes borbonicus]
MMDIQNIENLSTDNDDVQNAYSCGRLLRKQKIDKKICAKDERNASIRKVQQILQKRENDRTLDELQTLKEYSDAVEEVKSRWKKRDAAKKRVEEFEEPLDKLKEKCQILAQAIAQSQHLVVYTGAGISTAAKIPDYRGTNGIWTRLQQGKDIGNHDLSQAEPTFTHMALFELYRRNILKYVVSQNCDGLHLRSGLPKTALSELHGNMYIEVCKNCKPVNEYWRLFDVTENTARYSHKTTRKCYKCNSPLMDTIVHFGERGTLQWPLNWSSACKNAKKATTILCLGSSLKVLKKYPWLWQMDKPAKKRPNLYIVNLQWTPKDDCASVKVHGKCDLVMQIIMEKLGINVPVYNRERDPIFYHASTLCELEFHTSTQPELVYATEENLKSEPKSEENKMTANYYAPTSPTAYNNGYNSNILNRHTKHLQFDGCDNMSNMTRSAIDNVSSSESLPSVLKTTSTCILPLKTNNTPFTIESILEKPIDVIPNGNNCINTSVVNQALFKYYHLSNILLHNQMFAYPDLLYYPFQTSLLYSGLHNIISPTAFIADTFAIRPSETQTNITSTPCISPCEFCKKYYKSASCLFYAKTESQFMTMEYRFSKSENVKKPLVCTCCDYTTDEEDLCVEDGSPSDKIKKLDDKSLRTSDKEQHKKIQAGWFGKGYKKGRRLK